MDKTIDFSQELYKHFGQVKDFTIGLKIAEHFYHLGAVKEAEYNRDSEYKLSQMAVDVLDRKRVKPTLKGDALHRFKNEWNTIKQIMHWWETGKEFLNYRLALHWASWGVQNLQECFNRNEEEKAKMDIKEEPVSEDLDIAASKYVQDPNTWVEWIGNHGETDDISYIIKAFKAGAQWQKTKSIVDTCYHLEMRLPESLNYNGTRVERKDFIGDFRKALE